MREPSRDGEHRVCGDGPGGWRAVEPGVDIGFALRGVRVPPPWNGDEDCSVERPFRSWAVGTWVVSVRWYRHLDQSSRRWLTELRRGKQMRRGGVSGVPGVHSGAERP